jgi:2,5-diketo-D-gluconate reductase B
MNSGEVIQFHGEEIPKIGIGTWGMRGQACRKALKDALSMGYRHIDTAEAYGNEREVGEAISESGMDREQIFLTTKVWKNHLNHNELIGACYSSLRKLKMEYIDLYLVHWPNSHIPIQETMGAMHELVESGKIHHIGVSNFSVDQLREAIDASSWQVFTDQVKYHPLHSQEQIVPFCQRNDILVTAYSPLGRGSLRRSKTLKRIAERRGRTLSQVVLRWLVQQDHVIAIPKASKLEHQKENLDIFDFELSTDEMREISGLASRTILSLSLST